MQPDERLPNLLLHVLAVGYSRSQKERTSGSSKRLKLTKKINQQHHPMFMFHFMDSTLDRGIPQTVPETVAFDRMVLGLKALSSMVFDGPQFPG